MAFSLAPLAARHGAAIIWKQILYLKQPKNVTLRSGVVAGSGSVIVYMSAVKSPPQRIVTSPVHGMVQLVEAPNLVIVAISPLVGSSQLHRAQHSTAQHRTA